MINSMDLVKAVRIDEDVAEIRWADTGDDFLVELDIGEEAKGYEGDELLEYLLRRYSLQAMEEFAWMHKQYLGE